MSAKFRAALQDKFASHGFATYDEEIVKAALGQGSQWMKKNLQKQSGGRIAMPGEYFALPSQNLTNAANDNMTHVTDTYVRPGLAETFGANPLPSSCGGAPMTLSPVSKGMGSCGGSMMNDDVIFTNVLKQYRASHNSKGMRLSAQQKTGMKMLYNRALDSTLAHVRKTSPKTTHLKAKAFKVALDKKM
jgi:hypothetical protein